MSRRSKKQNRAGQIQGATVIPACTVLEEHKTKAQPERAPAADAVPLQWPLRLTTVRRGSLLQPKPYSICIYIYMCVCIYIYVYISSRCVHRIFNSMMFTSRCQSSNGAFLGRWSCSQNLKSLQRRRWIIIEHGNRPAPPAAEEQANKALWITVGFFEWDNELSMGI